MEKIETGDIIFIINFLLIYAITSSQFTKIVYKALLSRFDTIQTAERDQQLNYFQRSTR